MQKEDFIIIAGKVSDGLASDAEKQLFLYHLETFAKENPEWEKIDSVFRQQIQATVKSDIHTQILGEEQRTPNKKLRFLTAVAAVISTITLGTWLFYTSQKLMIRPEPELSSQKDIAPGKNTATLTLANSKTITLSEAKNGVVIGKNIQYNDGSFIDENLATDTQMLVAETPRGGTYQVILPDGSRVWLNAASKLKFPAAFNDKDKRVVELVHGEAYFEVAKHKQHPFIVENKGQKVEVLGTHFNVSAYEDEPAIKTTLLEGAVKVSTTKASKYLKPGQQSTTKGNYVSVSEVDTETETAWRNGDFIFNGQSLEMAMKTISRWYNIDVRYEFTPAQDLEIEGQISRSRPLKAVLNVIKNAGGINVNFEIKGREVIISK